MTIDKATLDTLGFIMTVGGIVLSIVALLLSILFYAWADKQAKASDKTLIELKTATDGLGQVVKTLREESFTLLKSAYTDMGEIAKFGIHRDSARTPSPERPAETGEADTTEPSSTEPPMNHITSEMTDAELQELIDSLAPHLIERRGSNFSLALKEAQRLIRAAIADVPSGEELTTEQVTEKLSSHGFDMYETTYTLALLAIMGRLADD